MGFTANFGGRSFQISSDIEKINNTNVSQAGGQLGFVFGNNIVRSRIGLIGYYSSGKNVAGTIDLFANNASINFYPLALIHREASRIQPYINGGLSYDRMKFYGYYLNQDAAPVNRSTSQAPYLGSIKQINSSFGAGFEFIIVQNHTFLHFFSEARYGFHVSDVDKNYELRNTSASNNVRVNVGIVFGARH
jgi:hypothetical protein